MQEINNSALKSLLVCSILMLASCGGGGNSNPVSESDNLESLNPPVDDPVVAQPPANDTPISSTNFDAVIDGPIPAPLNQSLYCEIDTFVYNLVLLNDGTAQYSDNDGGFLNGSYQISQNTLNIQVESGDTATSTNNASAGNLLVGVSLLSSDGSVSNCIARAHTVGDSLPEDIAIRCGRRNIGGEESNTYTLRNDGSAVWESLFELPGGVDTTRRQRLGTFLYDASANTVSMAFKELSGADILVFAGNGNESSFQMTIAPESGDGAQAAGQTCEYL